ncbi:hypothetical protein E2C01_010388 [Portunus trituberculatus]|uniref:Uncharacterized protein n=1 Tax=Portunus trituberculatus TaxID=210409 RepID=A0A5B7D887_PORTR|nr:hypothetical protein [Portunus trituberculatus]
MQSTLAETLINVPRINKSGYSVLTALSQNIKSKLSRYFELLREHKDAVWVLIKAILQQTVHRMHPRKHPQVTTNTKHTRNFKQEGKARDSVQVTVSQENCVSSTTDDRLVWDNFGDPRLLNVNSQVPVVENSCEVCDIQEKYYSLSLSSFSTTMPESGADSFNTASHFSKPSTSLPQKTNVYPDGLSPDLAEGYFLPHDNITSVGLDGFQPKDSPHAKRLKGLCH